MKLLVKMCEFCFHQKFCQHSFFPNCSHFQFICSFWSHSPLYFLSRQLLFWWQTLLKCSMSALLHDRKSSQWRQQRRRSRRSRRLSLPIQTCPWGQPNSSCSRCPPSVPSLHACNSGPSSSTMRPWRRWAQGTRFCCRILLSSGTLCHWIDSVAPNLQT